LFFDKPFSSELERLEKKTKNPASAGFFFWVLICRGGRSSYADPVAGETKSKPRKSTNGFCFLTSLFQASLKDLKKKQKTPQVRGSFSGF